jgi:hypothetical protein
MAQGSKGKYTAKQKRKATKFAKGYKERGDRPPSSGSGVMLVQCIV